MRGKKDGQTKEKYGGSGISSTEAFRSAMEKIGATPLEHGDIAYEFEVIDGFRVQMILWAGDDEFPPSSQILFSDNFPIAFQAEDMAVVGDISITMIKALA